MKKCIYFILTMIFVLLTCSETAFATNTTENTSNNKVIIVKVYANNQTFGAIDKNGKVYMWGSNFYGQCDVPKDLPPIVELGIGCYHVVALDTNGILHGWGTQKDGELDFPKVLPRMVSVTANGYQTTALSNKGNIYKWGSYFNHFGKDIPDELNGFKDNPPIFKEIKPADFSKAYEVYSYEDFVDAISLPYQTIEIKDDINITGDCVNFDKEKTLIIHPGVTVTVSTNNFNISGQIKNNGTIIVIGRICFYIESSEIGDIRIDDTNYNGEISYFSQSLDVDMIKKYLSANSIYTCLSFAPGDETMVVIDKNVTIPQGKSLWMNAYCSLYVNKGVTLKVKGNVKTFNQPVIYGKVTGKIVVFK